MNTRGAILVLTIATASLAARGGFVYETPGSFYASGDFNGDGIPDALLVDKAAGNARVGYGNGAGALTWSQPLLTGVENVTGLTVGPFLQAGVDAIAVTSPSFNLVNIVDLSKTNAAGAPQTFAPAGVGPHALAALGGGFLLIASSDNDGAAEQLDLEQWSGGATLEGSFAESGPFDRANGLFIDSAVPSLAAGIVRGAANDALDVWQFTNAASAVFSLSNLPAGSDYCFGASNFFIYQPGASNVLVAPLSGASPTAVAVDEAIQEILWIGNAALIVYADGAQALSSNTLSVKYKPGGNGFLGAVPLASGQFALLDSGHARVVSFNGSAFTARSTSSLPAISVRGSRANVWLFQLEPFVNRAPGFVASLNAPDWVDGVSGLPGAVQLVTETDSGAAAGLGGAASTNLGAPPASAAFGLGNQYNSAISVFAYTAPRPPDPVLVSISPPPGSYGNPLTIQFSSTPPGSTTLYRVNTNAWQEYAGPFAITNDATIQYYGTNTGVRASLQAAAYALGTPFSPPPAPPIVTNSAATNPPPAPITNEVAISQDGTLFYGRSSGQIWSINLDGSGDGYITTGFKPRASADGRWLAFLRNTNELWTRDLQSGAERMIGTGASAGYEWEMDDGSLLTTSACAVGDFDTNGNFTALFNTSCFAENPTRNPIDGAIAYDSLDPDGSAQGIFAGAQRVVSTVFGAAWPAWSPDGQSLSFRDSGNNLWLVSADGASLAQITGTASAPYGALWLEDGPAVVFAGEVNNTNNLWILPVRADSLACDGAPYALPTTANGDTIDFAGSIVTAPSTLGYAGPPPELFIRQGVSNIVVYWNANAPGFSLESQTDLASPPWLPITGPYYGNGPYIEFWEPSADLETAKFFRLHYTGPMILSVPPPSGP